MRLMCSIILMLISLIVSAQIDFRYNRPRAGDEIIKQQVEYKDPGPSGAGVYWDFSKVETVNNQYKLTYSQPRLVSKSKYILGKDTILAKEVSVDELLIGTEHNTMYYYRFKDNCLLLLGHENPTTLLQYTTPMVAGIYPTNYNEKHQSSYSSEGLYSSRTSFRTQGELQIQADAYGMMLLPDKDTLRQVLRVKTLQIIKESIKKKSGEDKELHNTVENYKWYTKGYRYPIFEVIKTVNDGLDGKNFETAFYFPLQDHLYLENDPENQAILDSLWNMQEDKVEKKTKQQNQLTYSIYPNPVETELTIEYSLEKTSQVTITIYSIEGRLIKTISKGNQTQGLYKEQLDCSNMTQGTYILRIQIGKKEYKNEKIVKK